MAPKQYLVYDGPGKFDLAAALLRGDKVTLTLQLPGNRPVRHLVSITGIKMDSTCCRDHCLLEGFIGIPDVGSESYLRSYPDMEVDYDISRRSGKIVIGKILWLHHNPSLPPAYEEPV